ncbi:MAG: hypothetical protein IPL12_08875 [Bacteroidetes bacterium]|nr:hypothetical protein [Bacteroidota bacterium]MBK8343399.1 hypothetical protein [Bacteroidota bacterium]
MKNHITIIPVILPALMLLSACDKGSDNKGTPDVTGPEIAYYEPDPNDVFNLNDTIFLLADVTDDSELQDFWVKLVKGPDTVLIWPSEVVIFGNIKSYHLDDYVIDTYNITSPATILYYAIDKKDNSTLIEVPIELQN